MRHLPKTGDQVGAADRGAAMLAHQPLHKRRADILILDQRADTLAFVIGEGGVLLAECRANSIKTEHVFFTFVGVEERADAIAMSEERIRKVESGWQMARNAPAGGRLTPLGLRYTCSSASTPVKTVGQVDGYGFHFRF
jgi:hypothetical protein